jgi:hypothetical protein
VPEDEAVRDLLKKDADVNGEIGRISDAMDAPGVDEAGRAVLRAELDELMDDRDELQEDIDRAETRAAEDAAELAEARRAAGERVPETSGLDIDKVADFDTFPELPDVPAEPPAPPADEPANAWELEPTEPSSEPPPPTESIHDELQEAARDLREQRRRAAAVAAVSVVMVGTVLGLVLLTRGGDDAESVAGADRFATAAPEETTSSLPGVGMPFIETFMAAFNQYTFSTTYTVIANDPDGDVLSYDWVFEPHEDCGLWQELRDQAIWTHPHESQREHVQGFPDDRYCQDSAQQSGGHPGVIQVVVSDGVSSCTYTYPDGSIAGVEEVEGRCEL